MIAALFPGQGSQHVGMGKSLYQEFSLAKRLFEEASDELRVNFKKLCFDGPEADLALTENTQPCLLIVSYAAFAVAQETLGLNPSYGAGHSLGEYSAVVSAGSLQFVDAVRAVKARGQFMQEAVPVGQGAMAAVMGLEDNEVKQLCKWAEAEYRMHPLEPANFNSPGQVVISGSKKLLDQLIAELDSEKIFGEKKRLKLIPLKVSAPFHCSMMKPAQDKMALILNDTVMEAPEFSVVQNVSAKEQNNSTDIRKQLIEQISSPVLWTQSVRRLRELGITRVVECGPGKVLAGLVKKIDSEILSFNIQTVEDIRSLEKDAQWQA